MLYELVFLRFHLQFRSYPYPYTFASYSYGCVCIGGWRGGGGGGVGGLHVKFQMGMLVHFFGFEIWADPVFFSGRWGCVENWRYFLKLRKATVTGALFTGDCNVIFRNYCIAIARKSATRLHQYTV